MSLLAAHLRGTAESCHSRQPWQAGIAVLAERLPEKHHQWCLFAQQESLFRAPCPQQQVLVYGSADVKALRLDVCGSGAWKQCKTKVCDCQQQCTALKRRTKWPAALPRVDPNHKGANVDTNWAIALCSLPVQLVGMLSPCMPATHKVRSLAIMITRSLTIYEVLIASD